MRYMLNKLLITYIFVVNEKVRVVKKQSCSFGRLKQFCICVRNILFYIKKLKIKKNHKEKKYCWIPKCQKICLSNICF